MTSPHAARFAAPVFFPLIVAVACSAPPRPAAPAPAASSAPSATSSVRPAAPSSPTPPTVPLRDVVLPDVTERKLACGLAVWHLPGRAVPLVHLRLVLDSGRLDDGARPGVAELTAWALARGAQASMRDGNVPPGLADRILVEVGDRVTVFRLDVLDHEAPSALALLGAMVVKPAFRQMDTEAARGMLANTPDPQRAHALDAVPGQPGAKAIAPQEVQTFYREHYGPKRAHLIVAGRMGLDDTLRRAEAAFGSWSGAAPAPATPENPGSDPAIRLIDAPGRSSALVVGSVASPDVGDATWPAAAIAWTAVRGKLPQRCPRDVGLEADPVDAIRSSRMTVCYELPVQEAASAIERTMAAFRNLDDQRLSEESIARARQSLMEGLAVRASSTEGMVALLAGCAASGAPPNALLDLSKRLRAGTGAQVLSSASTVMAPERWRWTVVGPADALRDDLARIRPVHQAEAIGPSTGPVEPRKAPELGRR
jgi:zinc protease